MVHTSRALGSYTWCTPAATHLNMVASTCKWLMGRTRWLLWAVRRSSPGSLQGQEMCMRSARMLVRERSHLAGPPSVLVLVQALATLFTWPVSRLSLSQCGSKVCKLSFARRFTAVSAVWPNGARSRNRRSSLTRAASSSQKRQMRHGLNSGAIACHHRYVAWG